MEDQAYRALFSATIASGFKCRIVSPKASLSCKKLKNAVLTKEANNAASSASGESAFVSQNAPEKVIFFFKEMQQHFLLTSKLVWTNTFFKKAAR